LKSLSRKHENQKKEQTMHFVVIGGDAAGMSAASRAKRKQPDLQVTVLEKTEDVSYSACGMPYAIADPQRGMDELVVRRAEVFREKQGIDLQTGHIAQKIDPREQTVSGNTIGGEPFTYNYDKLMIATGASPLVPDIPGVTLPGVMVLKNLEDGRKIKNYLQEKRLQQVAIIGMGYIALEMCEAFGELDLEISMLKPNTVFLPWMEESLAQVVRQEVESQGVALYLGHHLTAIEAEADGLRLVCEQSVIKTDMVLVAMGVRPNSQIAGAAGLELGAQNAIATNEHLQTSNANIYAAGDCADAYHVVTRKKTWIPLALRANRAGWAVADNVCGGMKSLPGVAGTAVFRVFNLEVARTGLTMREAADTGFDPVDVVIKTRSRAHAHPGSSTLHIQMIGDRGSGRLLGTQMVGQEGVAHRINAAAVALQAQMTVSDFSESDLAYAPPFGPVWDPLLTAANQLIKKLSR
jgi:NADPH-dependent 2,4-dienoyl-CoA reductase/sulfur reductase-like enzyme